MRRTALLGLTLLVSGCSGFGHFLGDTLSWETKRNAPIGDGENMRRARGQIVDIPPITTEPGNVWPGPPPPEQTLSDIERQQNINPAYPPAQSTPYAPDHRQPRPQAPGSSTPPGSNQPGLPPELQIPVVPPVPAPGSPAPSGPQVFQTPNGVLQGHPAPDGGYQTLTGPNGVSGGIAIPNGNGTSTVIAPNGTVTTVPTPR